MSSVDNLLQPFEQNKDNANFRNSLLDINGDAEDFLEPSFDQQDMVKSVSHGNGEKDVLVLGRFLTEGSDGTPGKSFAAFEASSMNICTGTGGNGVCTASEMETFADSIERYSTGITTTTATKITEELPQ